MTTTQKVLGGLGLGALLLYLTRPEGTVTTSESYDLPTNYPPAIINAAQAIARAEGFYVPGSIPQRANNPGNIKVLGWTGPRLADIPVFDSVEQGWTALY